MKYMEIGVDYYIQKLVQLCTLLMFALMAIALLSGIVAIICAAVSVVWK